MKPHSSPCSIRHTVLAALLLLASVCAKAQEPCLPTDGLRFHSTMLGAGTANTYDTYLSPLAYSGCNLTFAYQWQRPTHWRNILTMGELRLHGSHTQNTVGNHTNWGFAIGYTQQWHYGWRWQRWTLDAGGGAELRIGGLYNTHGGNNPAQAYVRASLTAGVNASHTFSLWKRDMVVRGQLAAPFLGMMFAPNRGQSYYNLFMQGNYDGNIVFAAPWNAPCLRGSLTLDIPIQTHSLRIGYLFEAEQALPNNLRQHTYIHSFVIGWTKFRE